MNYLAFGSSLHQRSDKTQVWAYVESEDFVHPLAAYDDPDKAEIAAFNIAHGAAKVENPDFLDGILSEKDAEPIAYSDAEQALIKVLIADTVKESKEPESGKAEVHVRRTDIDRVFVVRHVGAKES